ncbi:response regulator transcription factor [Elusimicrobiota bacterium]
MKHKILIVDDEHGIVETIKCLVETIDCEADVAYNGEEALIKIKDNTPDLIILDWMMPELSGWEVCRQLRQDEQTAHIPVIMLTARNTLEDEILGLNVGADDYIAKPFDLNILAARIKALLRRSKEKAREITSGDITINLDTHSTLIKEKLIKLRPKEFDVLYCLMSNKNEAVSREILSEKVWGYEHLDTTRAIDETIKCLRHKLGSHSKNIETVTGIGYRFVDK